LKTEETVQNRYNSLSLTPLELDIMKAVWRRHPITVKDVQDAIRPDRALAYTTVMTVMHRLYLKGFLDRHLQSKAHYYEPKVDFSDVRDAVVTGVIRHFFRGQPAARNQQPRRLGRNTALNFVLVSSVDARPTRKP
jgi:predicted transcriptional regulator